MKKAILFMLFTTVLLLAKQQGYAQSGRLDSLFAKGDTTAVMDSLMSGFDAFLDSLTKPKSVVSVGVGVGNRTFSIKNNSFNAQEATTRQLSFTPALSYFHKSGFGIGAAGFLANINDKLRFYQYAITPSYDYINRKVAVGISYTRYFKKDTAVLNASPYDNDVFGYLSIRHKSWRYGITAGYATGNFTDKLSYADSVLRYSTVLQRLAWVHITKTVESSNHIKDFSLAASVRKDFAWYNVLAKDDEIKFSLTAYLVTGLSKIKTSSTTNYTIRKLTLSKFRRSYNDANGNGFQLQSAALAASIFYTWGNLSVMPVWFMDYYFQDTDKKLTQVFSISLAYDF